MLRVVRPPVCILILSRAPPTTGPPLSAVSPSTGPIVLDLGLGHELMAKYGVITNLINTPAMQ